MTWGRGKIRRSTRSLRVTSTRSLPLRGTAHSEPDKYADELIDTYLSVEDPDALYAEYARNAVEFTRELVNMPWHENLG